MKTISISVETLKALIEEVETLQTMDSSLSSTIEITLIKQCDTHLANDKIECWLKSNYAECIGTKLYSYIIQK